MINVVLLKGQREKTLGLIGMSPIPSDTYFVFPNVRPGTYFHSRGVLEPFDIAFLDGTGRPIQITEIVPPDGLIAAPPGTVTVVEAKSGSLRGFRGMPGLGQEGPAASPSGASTTAFHLVLALVGAGVATIGYANRKKTFGVGALVVGGAVAAIGSGLFIKGMIGQANRRSS